MTSEADIYLRREDRRADLVLNRPHKRNALNLGMWRAIPELLGQAADDPAIRLLVVRGAGDSFAAGADITEFETAYPSADAALANQAVMLSAMAALEDFPKPTLALIRGACVGGGCGLALCCDLRFAADDARLGITPAKLGLVYGVSDTRRLTQAVGVSAAKDILFTGRLLDANEARRIGLVDRVVAANDLDAELDAFAASLTGTSGFTATATKRVFGMLRAGDGDDTAESRALFASAFDGADFREGFLAFTQKRRPDFQ